MIVTASVSTRKDPKKAAGTPHTYGRIARVYRSTTNRWKRRLEGLISASGPVAPITDPLSTVSPLPSASMTTLNT